MPICWLWYCCRCVAEAAEQASRDQKTADELKAEQAAEQALHHGRLAEQQSRELHVVNSKFRLCLLVSKWIQQQARSPSGTGRATLTSLSERIPE